MVYFEFFCVLSVLLWEKKNEKKQKQKHKNVLNMASSNSQIDKPQREHPKRAEMPDININTGVQSINDSTK